MADLSANAADATHWRHPAAAAGGNLRWTFTPKDSAPASGRPSAEPLPQRRPPTSVEDSLVGQPFPQQQRSHAHAAEAQAQVQARLGAEKAVESRAATLSGLWHPQGDGRRHPPEENRLQRLYHGEGDVPAGGGQVRRHPPDESRAQRLYHGEGDGPAGGSQARRHPPDESRAQRLFHGEARSVSLNFGLTTSTSPHEASATDPVEAHTGEAHTSATKARSPVSKVGPRGAGASPMLASFPSRHAPALGGGLTDRRGGGSGMGEEPSARHFSRRPAEEPSTQRPRLNEASSTGTGAGTGTGTGTGGVGRRSIDALSSPTFIAGDSAAVGRASIQGSSQPQAPAQPQPQSQTQQQPQTQPLPRSSPSAPPSSHRAENTQHVEAATHTHAAQHTATASPPTAAASPPAVQSGGGEDVAYLKRNMEHLCSEKHRLESQVQDLEARVHGLEQRKQQYKMLYEQVRSDTQNMGSGELEMMSLHQQLSAVLMLKEALNTENLELRTRLEAAQKSHNAESRQAACVICMDNLANVVCLPCKHLALCSYCGLQQEVTDCPICRTGIKEQMQVYTP